MRVSAVSCSSLQPCRWGCSRGGCPADAKHAADVCGDGIVSGDELCDPLHDPTCGPDCTPKAQPQAEVCTNGRDDDLDGQTDCDDGDCASDTHCATPPAEDCLNGRDDDLDGDTDCADSDCHASLSCLPKPCGNGRLDPGEECDRGAANAGGAACSTECVVDATKACAPRVPIVLQTAAARTSDGTWRYAWTPIEAGTSDVAAPAPTYCIGIVGGFYPMDTLFVFVPPEAGAYEFSTAHPGTSLVTQMTTGSDCGYGADNACNGDDPAGGARIILPDLTADRPVFVSVSAFAKGSLRPTDQIELTVRKVAGGVAAVGESCATITCAGGLHCVGAAPAQHCMPPTAPVIGSATATRVRPDTLEVALTVSDSDLDLAGYDGYLTFAEPLAPSADGQYALTLALAVPDSDWDGVPDDNGTIPLTVFDALGQTSAPVEVAFTTFPPASVAGRDAPCDLAQSTIVCDAGLACTGGSGGAVCGDPVAPVLDAITWRRTAWNQLEVTVRGSDPNGDVVAVQGQFGAYDGSNDFLWGVAPTPSPIGHTTFEGTLLIDEHPEFATQIGWVGLELRDASGLVSNNIYLDLERPTDPVATGASCDPLGVASRCGDADTCAADGYSGWFCAAAVGPTLEVVEGALDPDGNGKVHVHVRASDPNGDMTALALEWGDGTWQWWSSAAFLTASFHPSRYGRGVFEVDVTLEGRDTDREIRGRIVDASGRASRWVYDSLRPELASGAACGPDIDAPCSNDAALACGLGHVCEAAAAPELSEVRLERVDDTTLRLVAKGNDANGDVTGFLVSEGDFPAEVGPSETTPFETVTGGAAFEARGLAYYSGDATTLRVMVVDATRRVSGIRSATVPGIVKKGGACTGDPGVAICQHGTTCTSGTCRATPPTLVTLTVALDAATRAAVHIHATGTDPEHDVVTLRLALAAAGDVPYAGNPVVLSLIDPLSGPSIDWDGDAFVVDLDWPWTRGDLAGLSHGSGSVVDGFVNASNSVGFTFDPTLALGAACDAGHDSCAAGTACSGGTCQADASGLCGADRAVPAIDEVGVVADGGWLADFTPGESSMVDPGCVTFGGAREAVFRWTAPSDALAQVVTDLPGQTGYDDVAVREGSCFDPIAEVACAGDYSIDGSGAPTVTFEAHAGKTYFIIVENSWSEAGQVLLRALPYRAAGEACDPSGSLDACTRGLTCLGSICTDVQGFGDPCGAANTVCGTGLVCSGGACASDPMAPCGAELAGRVHRLDDVLVDDPAGWLVTYDIPDGVSYDDGACADRRWAEAGPEYVVRWTAEVPTRLTVTTAGELGNTVDTLVYVRREACRDQGQEAACSDDAEWGLFQSTVTLDVMAGETIYVFLDTHAGQSGTVKALFVPTDLYGKGHACDLALNDCTPGLTCADRASGGAICKQVLARDAACGAGDVQCGPGLVCDAQSHVCAIDAGRPCGEVAYLDARAADLDGNASDDAFELAFDASGMASHAAPIGAACAGQGLFGEVAVGVTAEADAWLDVSAHWDGQSVDSVFYVRMDACMDPQAEAFCQSTKYRMDAASQTAIDAGQTAYVFFDGVADWPRRIRIRLIPR